MRVVGTTLGQRSGDVVAVAVRRRTAAAASFAKLAWPGRSSTHSINGTSPITFAPFDTRPSVSGCGSHRRGPSLFAHSPESARHIEGGTFGSIRLAWRPAKLRTRHNRSREHRKKAGSPHRVCTRAVVGRGIPRCPRCHRVLARPWRAAAATMSSRWASPSVRSVCIWRSPTMSLSSTRSGRWPSSAASTSPRSSHNVDGIHGSDHARLDSGTDFDHERLAAAQSGQ